MMALDKLKTYDTVILDGDIFQPLSYNWCFQFGIFDQSLEFIAEFYRSALEEERIGFPDQYFYLHTDHENLTYRKEHDPVRRRGNFDKHTGIAAPHKRYYESLNELIPNYVYLKEAINVQRNVHSILENLNSNFHSLNSFTLLEGITKWLSQHKA